MIDAKANTLFKPGDRVGCNHRTTPIDTTQPWMVNDHRGTVLSWEDERAARMLGEKYRAGFTPVQWDFGNIFIEDTETLWLGDAPPPRFDWTKVKPNP